MSSGTMELAPPNEFGDDANRAVQAAEYYANTHMPDGEVRNVDEDAAARGLDVLEHFANHSVHRIYEAVKDIQGSKISAFNKVEEQSTTELEGAKQLRIASAGGRVAVAASSRWPAQRMFSSGADFLG